MRRFFLMGMALFLAGGAYANCPENIDYVGGGWLKRGDFFYYKNAVNLWNAGTLSYPNAKWLKRDDIVYYGNGQWLQRGEELYYPNGSFLKRDDTYYYANGQFLKRGEDYYHRNGTWARHNGKLYRPDGSETPFPVRIWEPIANVGRIQAEVEATKDTIDLMFTNLFVNVPFAYGTSQWDGKAFKVFNFVLNTGVAHENVYVRFEGDRYQCDLKPVPPSR